MQAEVIALGTELTNGSKLDTNSQWLSSELVSLGVEVVRHSTIGDSMAAMVECIQSAASRSQFVVITGGLGPTMDDLTRQAMAEAAGVALILHQPSLQAICDMFAARGRDMPARNEIQAMFPEGARPIKNPRGTAPGIDMSIQQGSNTCRFVALPGVPSEMKPMFQESIAPSLSGSGKVIQKALIHCFGEGESAIEQMLGDLTARGREPEVGITASEATISLRIVSTCDSAAECEASIAATREQIEATLGNLIFGYESETLPGVVVRRLRELGKTVCVVEHLTNGRVVEWLRSVDDESGHVVLGGIVADTMMAKRMFETEQLSEVAKRYRELVQADFVVAVGRLEGQEVEVGVGTSSGVSVSQVTVVGNPAIRQSRIAKAAINKLRLRLFRST